MAQDELIAATKKVLRSYSEERERRKRQDSKSRIKKNPSQVGLNASPQSLKEQSPLLNKRVNRSRNLLPPRIVTEIVKKKPEVTFDCLDKSLKIKSFYITEGNTP